MLSFRDIPSLEAGDFYIYGVLLFMADNGCGHKIKLIKLWRSLRGGDLKSAKEFVEGLIPEYLYPKEEYSNDYLLTDFSKIMLHDFLDEYPEVTNYATALIAEDLLLTGKKWPNLTRYMDRMALEFKDRFINVLKNT